MMTKSPSGALSPYYYKGGYFHGIHYGGYHRDTEALLIMMGREEAFILRSPERRRILIDLYETVLSQDVLEAFAAHIEALRPRVIKLAVASDKKSLAALRRALKKGGLESGRLLFDTDMERAKTWLVSDGPAGKDAAV